MSQHLIPQKCLLLLKRPLSSVKNSPFSTTLARKSLPQVAALSKREAHLFPFMGKALGKRRHDHSGCARNS
jgi:hypothetical protein